MKFKKIKKTFVAFSLAGVFAPLLAAEQTSIDNTGEASKVVTIGTATTPDKLNGHISTIGAGLNTSVVFRGGSSMEGGYIFVNNNSANGTTSSNNILLQETSFLNLKTQTATVVKNGQGTTVTVNGTVMTAAAAGKKEGEENKTIDFSILAVGNAANNINDLTTGGATTSGSIASNIVALSGGKNSITNLRNTTIEGSLLAEDAGSANTVSLDSGSNLKGYISAINGASNVLNINKTATLTMETTEENEKASILAIGENSKNTLKGNSANQATIAGVIFASNGANNTIALSNADIKGKIKAQDGGSNDVVLDEGSLSSVVTQGGNSRNNITLQGSATINGYIANLETTTGANPDIPTGSINTIVLNGNGALNLNFTTTNGKETDTNPNNAAISSTGKGNSNSITGNTTAENKITGDITASNKGSNTIILSKLAVTGSASADNASNIFTIDELTFNGNLETKNLGSTALTAKTLTMSGNITATGKGKNTLSIGNRTTQSSITGNITAIGDITQVGAKAEYTSLNTASFSNVTMTGDISATKGGKNDLILIGSKITGSITATDIGSNIVRIGNADRPTTITGKVEAGANGSNTIMFNSGSITNGIIATGANANNTITLGNATYTGVIESNVSAINGGVNTITIQAMSMTGNITADNQGKNTITDAFPTAAPSRMDGNIVANAGGENTITLQNVIITQGIQADGNGAKNIITLGNGIAKQGNVTSDIIAKAQGNNEITLGANTSLIGSIKAEGGNNTIKEDDKKTTSFLITGQILADDGKNTITLANAEITQGILAQNKGSNSLTISTDNQDYKLQGNITADSGGGNVITIGETNGKTNGILEGNILAKGNDSSNTITLNGNGFLKGNLWSNTQDVAKADQKNHNTITLSDTSSLELVALDATNPYAVYALGNGAKNTITDKTNGDKQFIITGGITADNLEKDKTTDVATNTIDIKKVQINGAITAYNAGSNTITFHEAQMQGNINADIAGKNTILMEANSRVNISGTVTASQGGVNTLTLKENASLSIASDNNDKAFQALDEKSHNTLSEENGVNDSSGDIRGNIFAQKKGQNTINVRKITIVGDGVAYGGGNTITIGGINGGKDINASMQGSLIADGSYNASEVADSANTLILNGSATLTQGQLVAQGTNAAQQAYNKVSLNNQSLIELQGKRVINNQGVQQGSGNDALFADSQKAYNEIIDNTDGTKQQSITGNIFAKDNSINDTSINSGNKVQLKNGNIQGSVIAEGGINAIILGDQAVKQKSTNIFVGNVIARELGRNTLTLHDTAMNNGANIYGILATTQNANTLDTSNTITLDGNSSIANTYLSAIQGGIKSDNTQRVINTLTLKDTTAMSLVANRDDGRVIYASGYNAKNVINDESTGEKSITGSIVANDMGNNTFSFKNITINNIPAIYGIEATGKETSLVETKNDITLNDNSSLSNTYILATQESADNNVAETSNIITLNDSSVINLRANHDKDAIIAQGLNTQNTIADNTDNAADTIIGNIRADNRGQNVVTLKNLDMQGSILASATGQNSLTFMDSNINTASNKQAIFATAAGETTEKTKNDLTLNGASTLSNTYLKAHQEVQTDPNKTVKVVSNSITLNGTSALHLVVGEVSDKQLDGEEQAAIFAHGVWATNEIVDNTASNHTITGNIKAKFAAINEILLNKVVMRGDIIAENNAHNMLTFGKDKNSGSFEGNIIALTDGSASENIIKFNGMQIGGAGVKQIFNDNGGINTITLDEASSLSNMYMIAQKKTSINTIEILDTESAISLSANPETAIAMFASEGTASNEIKAVDTNQKDHSITGALQTELQGSNSVTLNKLTLTGNIIAKTGKNTVIIKESGAVSGDIQAFDGGINTLEIKQTALVSTNITAENNKSSNTIAMKGDSSLNIQNNAMNAIFASDGSNSITQEATNETNNISGNILAQEKGTNTITLDNLVMKGDVLVATRGNNTLAFGVNGKQSVIEGNIQSSGGTNTITSNYANLKGAVITTGNADDNFKANNFLTLNQTSLEDSYLFAQTQGDAGSFEARNRIDLYDQSKIVFKDHNNSAILASGINAGNVINDLTAGDMVSSITSHIVAENSGTNTIGLRNVNVTGDIKALNKGRNTLEFGKTGGSNTLQGNLFADVGTNSVSLSGFAMTGSMIVLSDDSTNTLTLQSGSTMTGYMEAISENTEASNTLTIFDTSTIALQGASLKDKNNQAVGTGNDAIYTQGANSKNIIQDNSTGGGFNTITGNVTAVSGGKNSYSFNKIQMQGSMYALKEDASNIMGMGDSSYIQNGVIKAEGNGVSNTLNLKDSAKIENMYLEALADGGNAGNTITLDNTSTMVLSNAVAIKAQGEGSSNHISGNTTGANTITGNIEANIGSNTINLGHLNIAGNVMALEKGNNTISITQGNLTGNFLALSGGSNTLNAAGNETINISSAYISATGEESKNTIAASLTTGKVEFIANPLDKNAILADTGSNTLTISNNTGNGADTITGNIMAVNAGSNSIIYSGSAALQISGSVIADGANSTNTLDLDSTSKLQSGYLQALNGGVNTLAFKTNASFEIVHNNGDFAILAQGEGSKNDITSAQDSIIRGNIRAENGGINDLSKVAKLSLSEGYIAAVGGNASNTLISTFSAFNIVENANDKNAILADSGINNLAITATATATAASSISGNITAKNEGSNTLTYSSNNGGLSISGSIYALGGKNNISFTSGSSKIENGFLESRNGGGNTLTLNDTSSFVFSGPEHAILADGKDSVNTITSTMQSSITGNILALNGGINDLSKAKNLVISNAYIVGDGENGKNIITPTTASMTLQANAADGNAILASNNGGNEITLPTANNGGQYNITGNVAAKNGGNNTLNSEATLRLIGGILADGDSSKNTLNLKGSSIIEQGVLRVDGTDSSNMITLNETSKFSFNGTDYAILASGGSNKIVSPNTGNGGVANTITGNIIAQNGGNNDLSEVASLKIVQSSIIASGNQAKNVISPAQTNSILELIAKDGNAILADNGSNSIVLQGGNHTITGNIVAKNGGNTLHYGVTANPVARNGESISIIGGFIAEGADTVNDIQINSASSKISQSFLKAASGAKNAINLSAGSSIEISNLEYAMYADGGTNTIVNSVETAENTISGNIIAKGGGKNELDQIAKYTLTNGYISASGADSKNTLILQNTSSIALISNASDKNAILANGGENSIANGADSGVGGQKNATAQSIVGNVTASNSGANQITLKKLNLTGDIISSSSGKNTLNLTEDGSIVIGAFKATNGGNNTLEFSNSAKIDLKNNSGDGYAIFASGTNANNTLKDGNTTDIANSINGNIAALAQAINTLELKNVAFEGNIRAESGGKNIINFTKGLSNKNQEILASGAESNNTLNYLDYSLSGAKVEAYNGGSNLLNISLKQDVQRVATSPFNLSVSTNDASKNIIVVQGVSGGASGKFYYTGGETEILLSTAKSEQASDINGGLNPSNYSDGIMLSLDSNKANDVLGDFRSYSAFTTNVAGISMGSDARSYTVNGNFFGTINVLNQKTANGKGIGLGIDKHSSLNAKLANQQVGYYINLDESSKWFVGGKTEVALLSATNTRTYADDFSTTLLQQNTIVDMVSGGYDSKRGFNKQEDEFVTLTLKDTKFLDHVIFRGYADLDKKKADFINVQAADNGNTTSAKLQTYFDDTSLENATIYHYQKDNRANNILVATVESGAKDKFSFDISQASVVEQGYLLVETTYEKVRETKEPQPAPPEGEEPTPPADGDLVDNYYLKAFDVVINPEEAKKTTSLLSSAYIVYLSHVDSLNKRMGELRDGVYNNGVWTRSFVGQSQGTIGDAPTLKNTFVNFQVGYDYAFGAENSMSYFGFAGGYGYNSLKSSSLAATSSLFEGSFYYVYMADTGFYSDTVLKYNMITTTPQSSDIQNALMAHAFSLGEEFGYRVHFDEQRTLYLDTNANMIAGAITAIDVVQKSGNLVQSQMDSKSDLAILLRGSVGMTFGYSLKTSRNQTDFRIGAAYVGDYNLGKMQLSVGNIASSSLKFDYNQMVLASFGVNSVLTENLKLYFEGQMGFLGKSVNQNFLVNLGLRYSFGSQKRDYPSYAIMQNALKEGKSSNREDKEEEDE